MSKRCELQKEYYQKYGNYKGNGKYTDAYVKWLEDKCLTQNERNIEAVFCPECGGNEHTKTNKGYRCAFTDCQHEWC